MMADAGKAVGALLVIGLLLGALACEQPGSVQDTVVPVETVFHTMEFPTVNIKQGPLPHPDGLRGCKSLNVLSASTEEMGYYSWCQWTLTNVVLNECRGIETTEDALSCAELALSDVQEILLRHVVVPCVAISNQRDSGKCSIESIKEHENKNLALRQVWMDVLDAVSATPAVARGKSAFSDCLVERGHKPLTGEWELPWQRNESAQDQMERYRVAPGELRDLRTWALGVVNECGYESGLYEAQAAAWLAELRRLEAEEPDKAQPVAERGVISILAEPGVAAFLTLRR